MPFAKDVSDLAAADKTAREKPASHLVHPRITQSVALQNS